MTNDLTKEELRSVVKEAVHETLMQLGVDTSDPLSMQRDFQHLRDWRLAQQTVKSKSFIAITGIIISGVTALVWVGIKSFFE